MITLLRIITILRLILMVTGLKGEMMVNETEQQIQLRAANLAPLASEMDEVYGGMGFDPAGDFITNIMGQETHYGSPVSGYNPKDMHSMGLSQIDPIAYYSLLKDIEDSEVYQGRVGTINKHMQSKPGYEDWDMTKLADIGIQPKNVSPYAPGTMQGPWSVTADNSNFSYKNMSQYGSDPLSNMMLTRMMLLKDKGGIPQDVPGQAGLWKDIWNTGAGAGQVQDFIDKYNIFRNQPDTVNAVMGKNDLLNKAFGK